MDSNRTLSISDLFGAELTLVIPDMQRDYCWGGEKAYAFVSAIAMMHVQGMPLSIGLFYGYENPPQSGYLNIIDGQQRLTTLYLLLGMLYRRVQEPWLRSLLISDYKLIDDRHTRMLYQVRRESQYFLSDLVTQFFLDRNGRLSQLEKSDWYYQSYDNDPSAQNFIRAIRSIDQVLEKAVAEYDAWDFTAFAQYVAHDISFIFHDMGSRTAAEDMFVTINSTGEPLTQPQNLRALSLAISDWRSDSDTAQMAQKWNRIEDWCWMHRPAAEQDGTCDAGIDRLVALFLQKLGIKPCEIRSHAAELSFDDFYSFFDAYAVVAEAVGSDNALNTVPVAILPCVRMAQRFGTEATSADIERLWHFFCNNTRYQRPAASGSDIPVACRVAEMMPTPDILSLLQVRGVPERYLNGEERAKLQLIADHPQQRARIEAALRRAEQYPMTCGRIEKIIAWTRDKRTGAFDISRLEYYTDRLYEIFGTDLDCNPQLDTVRRSMLALRHPAFPIVRRGESLLSLCWRDYDWQKLMQTAPGLIRNFIDRCDDIDMDEQIARFSDRSYPYYFLVKAHRTVSTAIRRQLLRPCQPFIGMHALSAEGQPTTYWWVEQNAINLRGLPWAAMRAYGARCLYTDHLYYDIAVDLYFTDNGIGKYRIEFFNRPDTDREHIDLRPIAADICPALRWDKRKKRYAANFSSTAKALAALHDILNSHFLSADY